MAGGLDSMHNQECASNDQTQDDEYASSNEKEMASMLAGRCTTIALKH